MDAAILLSNPGSMDVADKVSSKRPGQLKRLQWEIAPHLRWSEKRIEELGPSFRQIHWHMPLFLTICVIRGWRQ